MASASKNVPAPVVQPPTTVTLVLSEEEARIVRNLCGMTYGGSNLPFDVYEELRGLNLGELKKTEIKTVEGQVWVNEK